MNSTEISKKNKQFIKKFAKLQNSVICIICSKLLYPQQSYSIKNSQENCDHIGLIYKYNNRPDIEYNNDNLKCCVTCKSYIKEKKLLYTYNDFGIIPKEINSVIQQNNYYLINKICLITMYCKTLKTTSYSFIHQNGNPKLFFKNFKNFMGSIGLIYDDETIDTKLYSSESKNITLEAIKWLKENNCLYKKYLCNFEKIINYLISQTPASLHLGAPMILSEHLNKFEILNGEGRFNSSGLIINNDIENQYIPPQIEDINVGVAIKRRKFDESSKSTNKFDIKYDDKDLEALIYVHLYPNGTGNWFQRQNGMTLNVFGKMRLLNADPRWRNDKYYVFNLLDRLTQARLLTINNMLFASTNIKKNVKAGVLKYKDYENYYKYGSHIPKSITGSKTFWKGKYLDLLAIISSIGFPKFFITLTANVMIMLVPFFIQ